MTRAASYLRDLVGINKAQELWDLCFVFGGCAPLDPDDETAFDWQDFAPQGVNKVHTSDVKPKAKAESIARSSVSFTCSFMEQQNSQ